MVVALGCLLASRLVLANVVVASSISAPKSNPSGLTANSIPADSKSLSSAATTNTNSATKPKDSATIKPIVLPETDDAEIADQPGIAPSVVNKKADGVYFDEYAAYQALLAKQQSSGVDTTTNSKSDKPKRKTEQDSASFSAQEIFFADNAQVTATLSNRDLNRILVKGDKIQSVNGPTGLYAAKNDNTGAAYISLYGDTHFTLFISTVKGHNISLLVAPKDGAGRTVLLQPTTAANNTHFEETGSYQASLITLMNIMSSGETTEDYTYHRELKAKKTNFYDVADLKPLASYHGAQFMGLVSEIINKSKQPLVLKPSYFYKPSVRAVSLSKQTIAVGEKGVVYQIFSRT